MNRPIKILVHGMTPNPGGLENFFMNYFRNINPQNIQFDLLCVNGSPAYREEIESRGGKIHIVPGRRNYFAFFRKVVAVFKENKYDALWSNRNSLAGGIFINKMAFKFGVPIRIIHAHNTGGNMNILNNRILHEINKHRIEKYATDFWACSQKAGEFFYRDKVLNSPKYLLVNNAINLATFRFDNTARANLRKNLNLHDKLVFGHIGRFDSQKNHEFLIRVFHEIHKKEPNSILLLIGNGKLRPKIENMTTSLNLTAAVQFLGVRSDIPALLSAMDILVFPSKFEGLGIALVEAQTASLYSFASNKVPSEVKITDLLSFVDLKETPEKWADLILTPRNYNRINMTEEVRCAGYDIKTEAAKLEQYLLDRMEDLCPTERK
jgi:glycosyltransferase involved in cell wall biosynthesis